MLWVCEGQSWRYWLEEFQNMTGPGITEWAGVLSITCLLAWFRWTTFELSLWMEQDKMKAKQHDFDDFCHILHSILFGKRHLPPSWCSANFTTELPFHHMLDFESLSLKWSRIDSRSSKTFSFLWKVARILHAILYIKTLERNHTSLPIKKTKTSEVGGRWRQHM